MRIPQRIPSATRLTVATVATALAVTALAACGSSGGSNGSGGSGSSGTPTAPASGSPVGAVQLTVRAGHLADSTGRTVYLWDADKGTTSQCAGACATEWPPVLVHGTPTAGAGITKASLGVTTRSDGGKQLDYGGHPLYYYLGDSTPGDVNGQGSNSFGAQWWELGANGKAVTAATSSGSGTSSGSSGGYRYGG